jgi:hypothetical protein
MIYIQSNNERTLPNHFDCSCALYGAIETEQDFRLTTYEELISGEFDTLITSNLFVGSVEFMREVYRRIGLTDVRLPLNSDREYKTMTLDQAYDVTKSGKHLFIKPFQIKLFTGLVLDGMKYSCLDGLPGDTKIMAYEPFTKEIESEWRVYVHRNNIIDSRNYSGSFEIMPDYSYVKSIISKYKDTFPCAYTIDVGILKNNTNVIIEFNDMWAIGNYGVQNDWYLRALRDRYFEITRSLLF